MTVIVVLSRVKHTVGVDQHAVGGATHSPCELDRLGCACYIGLRAEQVASSCSHINCRRIDVRVTEPPGSCGTQVKEQAEHESRVDGRHIPRDGCLGIAIEMQSGLRVL